MEKLRYLRHHTERAKYWSRDGKTPWEAAINTVRLLNAPVNGPKERPCPETPQFISAMAQLIEAYRNTNKIEELDDFKSDIYLDPMCNACQRCSNPARKFQLTLPGFENI